MSIRVKFQERYLKVSCPRCGASKGSKCRDRHGMAIKDTHKARADKLPKDYMKAKAC